jgi:hypothetical protein
MWYSSVFQFLNASISIRCFLESSGRGDKIVVFSAAERLLCAVRIISVCLFHFDSMLNLQPSDCCLLSAITTLL